MRELSQAFQAHLAGEATTLCHCWAVHRADGTVLGFTDHDGALTFDGISFEPQSGFSASEAEQKQGLSIDGFDVEGALDSQRLTDADIEDGLYDGARVDVFAVNWMDLAERVLLRRARIGKIVRQGAAFRAELTSLTADLDKPKGRVFMRHCDAELGDARCGKDVTAAPFRMVGVVTGTHADGLGVSGIDALAAGWFTGGTLAWTVAGGPRTVRIDDHLKTANGVRLRLKGGADAPGAGVAVTLTAGCDKQFATCRQKFANQERFRGFPHLPGNDAAYAYVTEGIGFDGGPLVP